MTASALLEAQAWEQAAQPKAIPPQLGNLVSENTEILTKILNISKKELQVLAQTYKDPVVLQQVLQALVNRGFIITEQHTEALATFKNNIGTAFQIGLSQGTGTPSPVMAIIQQTMTDSVMNYVTRMDAQLKKELGQILADGYRDKIGYRDITKQMTDRIGIKESRAGMIARTETMRSSNMANWSQAKTSGAQYFTVDHRGAACQYCKKYFGGKIFGIDETRYVPPIHPNCCCVAIYFQDKMDAMGYSQRVHERNVMERDLLTRQGHAIPKDGTGVNPLGREQTNIIEKVLAES